MSPYRGSKFWRLEIWPNSNSSPPLSILAPFHRNPTPPFSFPLFFFGFFLLLLRTFTPPFPLLGREESENGCEEHGRDPERAKRINAAAYIVDHCKRKFYHRVNREFLCCLTLFLGLIMNCSCCQCGPSWVLSCEHSCLLICLFDKVLLNE